MRNLLTRFIQAARHTRCQRGFTLLEVAIASSLAAITVGAITTTYIFSIKAFSAVSNYAEIHGDGRLAIDQFARDARAVYSIASLAKTNVTFTIPVTFSSTGGVTSNKTVRYWLNDGTLYRTDSSTTGVRPLAKNIYDMSFTLYDRLGNSTTVPSVAKGIQVDIKLRKYVMSQIQSEDYLSARLDMRNKP